MRKNQRLNNGRHEETKKKTEIELCGRVSWKRQYEVSFVIHCLFHVFPVGRPDASTNSSSVPQHSHDIVALPFVESDSDQNGEPAGSLHVDDLATGAMSDVPINIAERAPRFEDPSGHANVTVQLGGTAFLNCKVLDLQDKTVKLEHFC